MDGDDKRSAMCYSNGQRIIAPGDRPYGRIIALAIWVKYRTRQNWQKQRLNSLHGHISLVNLETYPWNVLKTDSGKSGSVGNKDKAHPMKWAGVQGLEVGPLVRR